MSKTKAKNLKILDLLKTLSDEAFGKYYLCINFESVHYQNITHTYVCMKDFNVVRNILEQK